jgi:hypothetical protein
MTVEILVRARCADYVTRRAGHEARRHRKYRALAAAALCSRFFDCRKYENERWYRDKFIGIVSIFLGVLSCKKGS